MATIGKILGNRKVFLGLIVLGVVARLAIAALGWNYDMESWYLVADITRRGGNVYVETCRYNYGPVWFLLLHALDVLAAHNHQILRYFITALLSLVDVGVFAFLCQRAGRLAGVLFFLNPVSIFITGFHCQFDNLAILLGLWSIHLLGDRFDLPVNQRKMGGLLLLGLSLTTKHLFFIFPVWLAVKQRGCWQKTVMLTVPVAIFLIGFAPYWAAAREEIIRNIFEYRSYPDDVLYRLIIPSCILNACDLKLLWVGLLLLMGFVCRARNGFESLLIYTGVLVAFAPVAANQYLAIPIALAAVFVNPFSLAFTVISTFHLCVDVRNGPHLWSGLEEHSDRLATYALGCALLWLLLPPQRVQFFCRAARENTVPGGGVD